MRDFKKIKAWQLADRLVLSIYFVTKNFPKEETYGITSQIRRACVSVATNIAEGADRRTKKDYIYFLSIAKSSLKEVEYLLMLSFKLGYISKDSYLRIEALRLECIKILHGLITYIVDKT